MTPDLAMSILELTPPVMPTQIKRQYHFLALKYHPDKNGGSEESTNRFRELNEAYHVLISDEGSAPMPTYTTLVDFFLHSVCNPTYIKLIKEVINLYGEYVCNRANPEWSVVSALEARVREWPPDVLMTVFGFICRYRGLLDIAAEFMGTLEQTINRDRTIVYCLHPTLSDLLDGKIYKLVLGEAVYYVPLWQVENYFDMQNGGELAVICEPTVPANVRIDEANGVHIEWTVPVESLREFMGGVYWYKLGEHHQFDIDFAALRLVRRQTVRFEGRGPPLEDDGDLATLATERAAVVFYINLV